MEYQPSHHDLGAKAVVHSPLDDGPPMTPEERRKALEDSPLGLGCILHCWMNGGWGDRVTT